MDGLKDEGFLMIPDDFIDQLIITLHANVTIINTMTQLAEIESKNVRQLVTDRQPTSGVTKKPICKNSRDCL